MVNALEEADLRSDSSSTIPGRIGICKCCFVFFSRGKNCSTREKLFGANETTKTN